MFFALLGGVFLFLQPSSVHAAGVPCSITPVMNEADLNACVAEAPTDNSEFTITLGANFSLTTVKNIPANTNITLASNVTGGATLSLQAGNTARHFNVNGALTLANGVTLQGYSDGTTIGGGIGITNSGVLNVTGGAISGSMATNGGGVNIAAGGTFNMTSGLISGNTAISGGGVFNNGKFAFTGGEINGNNGSYEGGGVDVSMGEFTMSDSAVISGNTANLIGGGVMVTGSTGIFTMNGGIISNNTISDTTGSGGGVIVGNYGTLTVNGGKISNNTAQASNGGGIAVYNNGIFNMTGGEISGNTAKGNAGGIYISSIGTSVILMGGNITNNTAGANGGAISIAYGSLANLTVGAGAVFAGNSASMATRIRPADQALYDAQIFTTNFSLPLPFNGYNNYDISYASDLPTDICRSDSSLWADDTKCVSAPGTGLFGAQISSATISVLSIVVSTIAIIAIFMSRKLFARR